MRPFVKVDYKDGQKWVLDEVRWDELFGLFDDWQREMQENGGRTPVAWEENSPFHGFSTVEPWIGFGNVSNFYDKDIKSEKSIYKYYQELIKIRKNHKAISEGKYKKVESIYQTYAFERIFENEEILIMLNFIGENTDLEVDGSIIEKYKDGEILINNYDDFDFREMKQYQEVVIKK
ncbi:hypothetical protein HIF96_08130 [Helcococcus kunzii]|uniref:alpha-amylase family glycosyl hydrolase n=1 Tax=Helcococcus kunzii TaxID=40091 RepID=UPI001C9425B1|nr:hypothetical protein [Helcococcus kunzii]QZO76246.1 hypothetical protein HIF96_08130 [Helcococcus kunzii]